MAHLIQYEKRDIFLNHRCGHLKCLSSPEEQFLENPAEVLNTKKSEKKLARQFIAADIIVEEPFNNK